MGSTPDLGALKQIKLPDHRGETERAIGRFQLEVQILEQTTHPGILKLLHANVDQHWMVTEYHSNGTLADHHDRYKGNARAALEAFRPLVEAIAQLHDIPDKRIVHRDIKPQNIFIASDGRLVLGDFGIVFYQDEKGERLTETFEKVGSRDWMPPWAHTGQRLEDVKPSFDVFMLGKVLWPMVSGRKMLPFWYWDREQYNLEKLFPGDPDMALVNRILGQCVVEEEKNCAPSAKILLERVDEAIAVLSRGGQVLDEGVPRPCRVCRKGELYAPT